MKKILNLRFFCLMLPFFIVLVLFLIFAFPYVFRGLIPFPGDYLVTSFPPWQYYYGMPVKNSAMPDVVGQIFPWRHLTLSILRNNQFPLWNPFNFSGNPYLANFQSSIFHPGSVFFYFLPETDAWSIMILLQPLLAGIFMLLFCRKIGLGAIPRALSAVVFMFCGFVTTWMEYGTLAYAIIWLPAILLFIEKLFEKQRFSYLFFISIFVALSFFSGHFQTSLYLLAFSVAYCVFKLVVSRDLTKAILAIFSIGFGVLMASPQILPTLELYKHSVRSGSFGLSEVIPWNYLITLISPDYYGNPVTRNNWYGHYAEWNGFVGTIPLILGFLAIITIKRKSYYKIFFALIGLSTILLALPTPLLNFFVSLKIPVLSNSAHSRIICLFSFSWAILAGFGLETLKEIFSVGKNARRLISILAIFALIFALTWLIVIVARPFSSENLAVAKRNMILPSVMFFGLCLAAVMAKIARVVFKKTKHRLCFVNFSILLIFLLCSFDLLRFSTKWNPFTSKALAYPSLPITDFLTSKIGSNRVFGFFGMEMQNYFGIQGFDGYDPLYIRRYGEFLVAADNGIIKPPFVRGVGLARRGKYTNEVLNLLGGKYILHAIADNHFSWAFPFWEYPDQFKLVYRDEKYEVYENLDALPRAFIVYDYLVENDAQKIIDTVFDQKTDLARTVVVEEKLNLPKAESPEGKAEIKRYSPSEIIVGTESNSPGILFLSDNYFPGWKAWIDGVETQIYRADYSFRSLVLPSGNHVVRFSYEPWSFKLGTILFLSSVVMLPIAYFVIKKK